MSMVLIVEDDATSREALTCLLEKAGREVATAGDGQEALECLHTIPGPSLILLDLSMPVMDGWEFLRHQRTDPSIAGIPTVVVSGSVSEPPAGANDVLAKPVNVARLMTLVRRYS